MSHAREKKGEKNNPFLKEGVSAPHLKPMESKRLHQHPKQKN